LPDGQEAHWEIVQRILFIFAKLNPGNSYVQGNIQNKFFILTEFRVIFLFIFKE